MQQIKVQNTQKYTQITAAKHTTIIQIDAGISLANCIKTVDIAVHLLLKFIFKPV